MAKHKGSAASSSFLVPPSPSGPGSRALRTVPAEQGVASPGRGAYTSASWPRPSR
jgi:hypothetical protein